MNEDSRGLKTLQVEKIYLKSQDKFDGRKHSNKEKAKMHRKKCHNCVDQSSVFRHHTQAASAQPRGTCGCRK